MKKIAIITDSSCDLTEKDRENNDIYMMPLKLIYKDKEYLDKIDITSEEMYSRLKDEVPTTSLPDLEYCKKVLNDLIKNGYTHAIVITISIALSGTHNALKIISEEIKGLTYSFFDTKTLGFPVGAISLEVSKLLKSGVNYEEVINMLPNIRDRTRSYIAVDTLEFLVKGGRIGKVMGTVGEILHMKPIISSNDNGELYSYAKIRGKKKSINKIKELLNDILTQTKCKVWILQGDAIVLGKELYESFKNHPRISEISFEAIGAAMGSHTGPGVVGFTVIGEEKFI